jgi:hypothetical protein
MCSHTSIKIMPEESSGHIDEGGQYVIGMVKLRCEECGAEWVTFYSAMPIVHLETVKV